jgi:hypothetical protein
MTHLRLFATTIAAALIAGAASAQPAGSVREACAADMQKACPDAKPGPGGGMAMCGKQHFSEFSQPCQSALVAMRARMQAARAAKAEAAPTSSSPPPGPAAQ